MKGRWQTFGDFGRMKLTLEDAREIVENDPMDRVPRAPGDLSKIAKVELGLPKRLAR